MEHGSNVLKLDVAVYLNRELSIDVYERKDKQY